MSYDEDTNLFIVNVEDEPYLNLPYVAPNQNYGDADDELFRATIAVNNKVALDQTIHWNFFSISEKIETALGADRLAAFSV